MTSDKVECLGKLDLRQVSDLTGRGLRWRQELSSAGLRLRSDLALSFSHVCQLTLMIGPDIAGDICGAKPANVRQPIVCLRR